MEKFLAMGGYAPFVWPAYGIALVVLAGLLVHSLVSYRRAQRDLDAEERR
jgi:heme exporter protein D